MLNKPIGFVTALSDPQFQTVMELIQIKERVFPVGRLDFNTSGLLLFTNDGDLANLIAHPSNETKKTYKVLLHRPIIKREILKIEEGVDIGDVRKSAPAKIKKLSPMEVTITIHEGRNRIVRRIFKALEIKVLQLERISIGKLELDNLKLGKFKILTKKEIEKALSK